MRPVPKVSKGATISISFPRPGMDAQRDDIPAGSDKQEIARWNGERWESLVNPEDLKDKFERSISTYPPEIANQWREDFNKFTQDFPLKVPESLKKKIKDPQQNQAIKKGLRKQNQQSDRTQNQTRRKNTAKTKKR